MSSFVTVWNTLEITKLIVSSRTPLALAVIAYFLSKCLKDIEQIQWASRKVVEIRSDLYSRIAHLLNDFLCIRVFSVGGCVFKSEAQHQCEQPLAETNSRKSLQQIAQLS